MKKNGNLKQVVNWFLIYPKKEAVIGCGKIVRFKDFIDLAAN